MAERLDASVALLLLLLRLSLLTSSGDDAGSGQCSAVRVSV